MFWPVGCSIDNSTVPVISTSTKWPIWPLRSPFYPLENCTVIADSNIWWICWICIARMHLTKSNYCWVGCISLSLCMTTIFSVVRLHMRLLLFKFTYELLFGKLSVGMCLFALFLIGLLSEQCLCWSGKPGRSSSLTNNIIMSAANLQKIAQAFGMPYR